METILQINLLPPLLLPLTLTPLIHPSSLLLPNLIPSDYLTQSWNYSMECSSRTNFHIYNQQYTVNLPHHFYYIYHQQYTINLPHHFYYIYHQQYTVNLPHHCYYRTWLSSSIYDNEIIPQVTKYIIEKGALLAVVS